MLNINTNLIGKIFKIFTLFNFSFFFVFFLFSLILLFLELVGLSLIIPFFNIFLGSTDDLNDNSPLKFLTNFINFDKHTLLYFIVIIYTLKIIFFLIANFIKNYFLHSFDRNLSDKIFKYYLNLDYQSFINNNSSKVINTIMLDVGFFTGNVLDSIVILMIEPIVFVGIIIFLISINPFGIFVISSFFIFSALFYMLLTKKLIENFGKNRQENEQLRIKTLNETFVSFRDIKINDSSNYFLNKFMKYNKRRAKAVITNDSITQSPRHLFELLTVLSISFFIFFLSSSHSNVQIISYVSIFGIASIRLIPSSTRIINASQSISYSKSIIEQIYNLTLQMDKNEKIDYNLYRKHPLWTDRDYNNLYDNSVPTLSFSKSEIKIGREFLHSKNIDKFVCLIVRDSSYLKKKYPNNDWTYHNHRDSDIELFIDAANYLTKLGYHVIRMGDTVTKSFNNDNPMIIDYATNGMRTDFLDIFLGAHCSFCISTGLGYDGIPAIFRRPIVFIGYVPISSIHLSSKDYLLSFKHHYSTTLNRNLSLQEIFDLGLAESFEKKDFDRLNVELKELNPEEIQNVTREMVERLNNNYKETEEEKELQDKFWQKYKSNLKKLGVYDKFHGEIRGQISTSFLKMNKYILN